MTRKPVDGQQVALVRKRWFAVRDRTGLSVAGHADVRAMTVIIEHVEIHEREHR